MFITLEGSEGSGKTSHISALAGLLKEAGYEVLTTREPGGTLIGNQIRAVLHAMENTAMEPRTETLLFLAARAQLIEEVIRPHLNRGGAVISDRYADSTLAYQGYGRGLDLDQLHTLLAFATCKLKPDLTVFLDVDVEEGLRRKAKGGKINRLDVCDIPFYLRVREGYLNLVKAEPQRWVVIDANQPLDRVRADIRKAVRQRLEQKQKP